MSTLTDIELLTRLVSFDTTSATAQPTLPLGDMVCNYLDVPGIGIERFDCGLDQENIYISTGPNCERNEGLLLSGHVDCVPALEPEWRSDPFELIVEDDRLIGRGACDMKGFVAIALNRLREHAVNGHLQEPLAVLLSCNEEIGTVGAGQFVKQWGDRPIPRRVVVGEPTSLTAIRGHKGHASFTFAIGGRGGHSGFPSSGVNAIEEAIPVLEGLRELRRQLVEERAEWSDLFPDVPHAVLSIASMEAGSAINVIPEMCTLRVGIRMLPGQVVDDLYARIRECVPGARMVDASDVLMAKEEDVLFACTNCTPSFGISADEPFLAEVKNSSAASPDIGANYGTDAGRLLPLGCTPVVCGPGDISVAHKPNEWMPLDEFRETPKLLDALIR